MDPEAVGDYIDDVEDAKSSLGSDLSDVVEDWVEEFEEATDNARERFARILEENSDLET